MVNSGLHGYNKGIAEKKNPLTNRTRRLGYGVLTFWRSWALETFNPRVYIDWRTKITHGVYENIDWYEPFANLPFQSRKKRWWINKWLIHLFGIDPRKVRIKFLVRIIFGRKYNKKKIIIITFANLNLGGMSVFLPRKVVRISPLQVSRGVWFITSFES